MIRKRLILFAFYTLTVFGLFFLHPPILKTDLTDMLPKADSTGRLKQDILSAFMQTYMAQVNILFSGPSHDRAKEAGLYFKQQIAGQFSSIHFDISKDMDAFTAFFKRHPFKFVSDQDLLRLKQKDYDAIEQDALSLIYSPIRAFLVPIADDPFHFSTRFVFNTPLLKTPFQPKNGVLSVADADGTDYVYMRILLDKDNVFSPGTLLPAIDALYDARQKTLEKFPDTRIALTGVPVHAQKATASSIKEINILSICSALFILFLTYYVFRSFRAFFSALLTLFSSVAFAAAYTGIVFQAFHVLVLVFGTSLIGLCIDYHVHYLISKTHTKDSKKALTRILPPLCLALATTLTGFLIMAFFGIGIISQMAFFAAVGMLHAFFILLLFYPAFFAHVKLSKPPLPLVKVEHVLKSSVKRAFQKHTGLKITLIILACTVFTLRLSMSSTLKDLYMPDEALLHDEALFSRLTHMGGAPVFLIARGPDTEHVLRREETARDFLDMLSAEGKIDGYRSLSQALPSRKKQSETSLLIDLFLQDRLPDYLPKIGLSAPDKDLFLSKFRESQNSFLSLDSFRDSPFYAPLQGFVFIRNGQTFSITMIEHAKDKKILEDFSRTHGFFYSDQIGELSTVLRTLQNRAIFSFFIAFTAIFLLLFAYYRTARQALAILTPSFLSILMTLSILSLAGVFLSLFHVLAFFLLVAFGIDYSVFRTFAKKDGDPAHIAIFVSCLTTIVSFAGLSFTSFAVTQSIGIVMTIGLFLSYFLSPIAPILFYSGKSGRPSLRAR